MTIFESGITIFPSGRAIATLSITSPENSFTQRVTAQEAAQWMALVLASDGKLSIHRNSINPDIVTYTAMGVYDTQE